MIPNRLNYIQPTSFETKADPQALPLNVTYPPPIEGQHYRGQLTPGQVEYLSDRNPANFPKALHVGRGCVISVMTPDKIIREGHARTVIVGELLSMNGKPIVEDLTPPTIEVEAKRPKFITRKFASFLGKQTTYKTKFMLYPFRQPKQNS